MCGIVGLIARNKMGFYSREAHLFTNMLEMDTIRGPDSTGIFGVSKAGNVDIMKGATPGWVFTRAANYKKIFQKISGSYHMIIGHNRKATAGAVNSDNAHPFYEGDIVLVHNGTISNSEKLKAGVEVDSHAICHALNEHNAVDGLGKIDGAYALVWYNKKDKALYLARNKQRPLYLVTYDDFYAVSSEAMLPIWLQRRENVKEIEVSEVPIETILKFDLNELSKNPEQIAYKEFKAPPYVSLASTYNVVGNITQSRYYHHKTGGTSFTPAPTSIKSKEGTTYYKHSWIKVRFEEDEDMVGMTSGTCYIGNPVNSEGVSDKSIIAKYWVSKSLEDSVGALVLSNDILECRISNIHSIGGYEVLYLDDARRISDSPVLPTSDPVLKSFNGQYWGKKLVEPELAKGCLRCNDTIPITDIEKTLIARAHTGTGWRILCHKCIETSIQNAKEKTSATK